jgi:hypothetical protein
MNAGELRVDVHGVARRVSCAGCLLISPSLSNLITTVQIKSNHSYSPIPLRSTFIKEPLGFPGLEPAVPDQNPNFEFDLL